MLVLAMVAALLGGYQLGFVTRLASWIGLALGLVVATVLLPAVLRLFEGGEAPLRLFGMLATYFLLGSLGSGLGQVVGYRIRRSITGRPARSMDSAVGAVTGIVGVLALVWLLAPVAAEVPGVVAQQVRNSAVTDWVNRVAPRPPDQIRALRRLVARTGFPEVFTGLRPAPDIGSPPEQLALPPEVLDRVVASSVAVESVACGVLHEGSGFVVAPRTVVTNAHVVAGAEQLQVRVPGVGLLDAAVTVFDDDRDLAVLDVPALQAQPLPIGDVPPGTEGAVVGYPGGQDQPRPQAAAIRDERTAVGRDIYGNDRTERRVLFLAADLARGDSGGPLVDPQGAVVGVAFAIAPDRAGTAYALDDSELRAVLNAPRGQGAGPCL